MRRLYHKISRIGIKDDMTIHEQKSIILLNSISMLFIVFFGFISIMSYKRLSSPIIGNLYLANVLIFVSSFFIVKYSKPDISRFLISIFVPLSLVFVGAYAKSQGVTDNLILYLSPRMLLSVTIIIPVLLFGYREIKKTLIAVTPGLLSFIFYDKIHAFFGVYMENLKFEPEYYGMFLAMIILFIFFTISSILFLQNVNLKSEQRLYDINQDLSASEEELKQQNEEILSVNESLLKQQKIILEQKNELQKLLTAVEQSENIILITDKDGKIQYANPAFTKLTGYTKEEVIGKNPKFLKTDYHPDEFYQNLWETILSGKVWKGVFRNKKKNGEYYWEEATITPLVDVNNDITHFITIKEDITERKEKEEQLEQAYEIIKDKNESITHSIHYAQRIQSAILSDKSTLEKNFSDFFIFNKPLDIVGGDFYYFNETDTHIFLAVGDCTGHGVPGGFMTMLGYVFLDDTINSFADSDTGKILNKLRNRVIRTLNQDTASNQQDGIDLALCKIEKNTLKTQFSGAYNPLMIISDDKYEIIKADRMPIGNYPILKPFSTKELQLHKNDIIHLFTDGYQDQFGGENNQKFYQKNFYELLYSIRNLKMSEQAKILEETLQKWLGRNDQLDDILIIGIKI